MVWLWLLLVGNPAHAQGCPWGKGGVVASLGSVSVGQQTFNVKGAAARAEFHEVMNACGVSEEGHVAFDRWRSRRRTINTASIMNVFYGIPVWVSQPAKQKNRLLAAIRASRASGAPAAVPTPPQAVPVEPLVPVPVASAWPSVDDPFRVSADGAADAAVVVGLEDYAFIADVPYARRDAAAFYNAAVYTMGIPMDRVHHLEAGSVEQIRAALTEAGQSVGPGGKVWVYYAGHGAASPTSREQVLLGDDVRADPRAFDARALAVSEVERLASAGGGQPMLVLDTCFAGQGRGGDDLVAGTRFAVPAYAATSDDGVQWTAAGPNELSGPLDDAQHGVFTYFAVGALRGWADGELSGTRDGEVTGDEAQAYVRRALKAVQQRGQTPAWVGAAGGDVVLSRGTEVGPDLP